MDATGEAGEGARGRRGERRRVDPPHGGERRKRSLVISDEAWERLIVHAARERRDKSAVVESLLNANLRRYVVQDRGGRAPGGPASPVVQINLAVENLPPGETLPPEDAGGEGVPPGGGEGSGPPAPTVEALTERARRRAARPGQADGR